MNLLNESMCAGLKAAMGAVFTLDDRGAEVTRISLEGGKPILDLAAEPPFPLPHEPSITHVHEGMQPAKRLCRIEIAGVLLRWYETQTTRRQ